MQTDPRPPLTIVALGASAGGLEALQGFFAAMPVDPRFAFVVMTHLSPHHASLMPEILQRATAMPVAEAQDGDLVEPGRVYVLPPDRQMSIGNGCLRVEPAAARPPNRLPIDHFMRALAEDQQERAVGIVFSGTEHDGTAGLKEIRAAGGLTLAQDPATAQFPGMPCSAIDADAVDAVLNVANMGRALIDSLGDPTPTVRESPLAGAPADDEAADALLTDRLKDVLELVRERTGQEFRWYRPAMLRRRLRRRMGLQFVADVDAYLDLLRRSDFELHALVKDFLISVTEFFRQPGAWRTLEDDVLPRLFEDTARTDVRVWNPGCATGEESYTIAMLLLEQRAKCGSRVPVHVFGSDADGEALRRARSGAYPASMAAALGPQRLAQFFEKHGNDGFVARKELRETVLFARQDLVRDPPFSRLDLIVCRNVLIYFEPAQQGRVLELFHFSLNPNGFLFLGQSESLGQQAELFDVVARTDRIFRRAGSTTSVPRPFEGRWSGPGGYLTPGFRSGSLASIDPADRMRRQLGDRAHPAVILVNRDGRPLYFLGETARFLQPSGAAAWDLPSLLRDGLRPRVRAALNDAIASGSGVDTSATLTRDGHAAPVRVRVEPLSDFQSSGQLLVLFDDTATPPEPPAGGTMTDTSQETEVQRLRDELATSGRASEHNNAELRVAHEELMSLNEELQASNEELQTSKEELQSVNEELTSVNSQLEEKIDALNCAFGDLRNFMDSARVATVFLDPDLRVRRFTQEAARLFRLIPADEGRPLRDIVSNVVDPTLLEDAAGVLANLQSRDREVATPAGEWFLRRILPYRSHGERIEGVVISHTEITALRKAADDERRLATVLRDANDAVIVHDFEGRILFWNRGAVQAYAYEEQAALELNIRQLEPAGDASRALQLAAQVRDGASIGHVMVRRVAKGGALLDVLVTVSSLRDDSGTPYAVVTTERDVTATLHKEIELRFRTMADHIPTLLRIEDAAGQAEYLNRAWLDYTGETTGEALLANGWFRCMHPDDLPGYVEAMNRARAGSVRFDGDLRLRRHDGVYRWMRTAAVPRGDEIGRPHGYVCVSIDIEERKRAEQALANEGRRKDEFLAMLAHELRNPLFPIANAVQVLERSDSADPKIAWAGQVIDRQTRQLVRLVDDLMDVARITSGKIVLSREPIAVAALINLARDQSQPLLDGRQQRLTITLPPETHYLEGDLVRLTQVFGNLLNNASKYSATGAEIGVTVTSSGPDMQISVADRGIGISPEMLPRVFDLFSQEDQPLDRPQGGLGIGLNVVERLVHAHGGSVEAHSGGRGHGSEFIVHLPQLQQRSAPAPAPVAGADKASGARRVLVVDDNLDGTETLGMLLEDAGHTVRTANDGDTALVTAREFSPEVVLLDIGLPGMSGYEVARRLRGRGETARALLVALTGYGQVEDLEKSRAAGFDFHLVKPTSVNDVLALIRQQTDPAATAAAK